jgi:hypothetical protein
MSIGDPRPPLDGLPVYCNIPGRTDSNESFVRVASWLQQCLKHHNECGASQLNQLPTRLVDVSGDPSKYYVKLVETKNMESVDRYLALSHCWGQIAKPCKTMQSTLEAYKKCIEWEQLPKTFQDAIKFTRKLGYRFIWIDSLCIIQDSSEDWRKEAAQMQVYYSKATATLAATFSSSDEGGLFFEAKEEAKNPVLLSYRSNDDKEYNVYIRRQIPHFTFKNPNPGFSRVGFRKTEASLLTRAWCFQERLLSRRLIHFGQNEISWECLEKSACECYSSDETFQPTDDPLGYTGLNLPKIDHQSALKGGLPKIRFRWRRIIEEYSDLNISFGSDKLPALSGITSQIFSPYNIAYLAGLMQTDFINQLTWYVSSYPSKVTFRPKDWRAPTWSWASVDSPVHYFDNFYTLELTRVSAEVLEVAVQPKYDNFPYGEVKSGLLILNAYWIAATLSSQTPYGVNQLEVTTGGLGRFLNDVHIRQRSDGPDEPFVENGFEFTCLYLGHQGHEVYFFVVCESRGSPGKFERIGICPSTDEITRPLLIESEKKGKKKFSMI